MPVFVVRVSPSSKSQRKSSMIVGSGEEEPRASKFTVPPTFTSIKSAEITARGLVADKPVHPATETSINIAPMPSVIFHEVPINPVLRDVALIAMLDYH
jgi:hypothetical protein